jgi:hypothetical protein
MHRAASQYGSNFSEKGSLRAETGIKSAVAKPVRDKTELTRRGDRKRGSVPDRPPPFQKAGTVIHSQQGRGGGIRDYRAEHAQIFPGPLLEYRSK